MSRGGLLTLLLSVVSAAGCSDQACPQPVCANIVEFRMEALNLVAEEYELRVGPERAMSCHWTAEASDCQGLLEATIDSNGTLRTITWSGVQPGPIRLVVIADGVLLVERDYRYVGRPTTNDGVCDASCGKTTIEVQ